MKGFPDLPPIWWAAATAAIHGLAWWLPGVHVASRVLVWLSWGVLAAGLGLIGWAGLWFWRKRTPIEPHHTPRDLIVEGPYRVTRNPIYLALVMLCLATALGQGSVLGLGIAAALWWVLDRRFAAPEEAILRGTFGARADSYLARSRRWL